MKTIVVGQQKGGVGKSTLSGNLALAFAIKGDRVMLIDTDKQQTCTKWASRRKLAGYEPEIQFASLMFSKNVGYEEFSQTIKGLGETGNFDICIIDVGGRDNNELRASMSVADVIMAPCLPSLSDVESLDEFDAIVGELKSFGAQVRAVSVINKATTGLNFSDEIFAAAKAIEDMENIEPPIGTITDRPSIRNAWREGQGVHDLSTESAVKARKEIDKVVDAL